MNVFKMLLHKFKLLFVLFLLSSCSLTPLYKSDQSSSSKDQCKQSKLQIKIKLSSGESYSVFKLKNILEQKKHIIEPLLQHNMVLSINISENFASIGINTAGDTVRNQGRIAVDMAISPAISENSITKSKTISIDSVSSYNLEAADEFSSETAKSSVRDRLLIDLSEQIIRETIAFLKR